VGADQVQKEAGETSGSKTSPAAGVVASDQRRPPVSTARAGQVASAPEAGV
jgi:hypothetical protein